IWRSFCPGPGERQVDVERHPALRSDRRGDPASVRLERALGDREPESGAVRLEREEGLEETRHRILGYTRAGIAQLQRGVAVGGGDPHTELTSRRAAERLHRALDQ